MGPENGENVKSLNEAKVVNAGTVAYDPLPLTTKAVPKSIPVAVDQSAPPVGVAAPLNEMPPVMGEATADVLTAANAAVSKTERRDFFTSMNSTV